MALHLSVGREAAPFAFGSTQSMSFRIATAFRAIRNLTIGLSAALAVIGGPAAEAGVPVWNPAASMPATDVARFVEASPASPVQSVAAALAAMPAGSRGLVMTGFADDIADLDSLSLSVLSSRSKAVRCPSPWLDRGILTVRSRVQRFAQQLAANGVAPDAIIFRNAVSLDSTRYAGSWPAIGADPRSVGLRNVLGFRNFALATVSTTAFRARWDVLALDRIDIALTSAASMPLRAQFPSAALALQRSTAIDSSASRRSSRFGTHDMVSMAIAADSLASLRQVGDGMRRLVSVSPRATLTWFGPAVPDAASDQAAWWAESAFHAALSGTGGLVVVDAGSDASRAALTASVSKALASRLGTARSFAPRTIGESVAGSARVIMSAGEALGKVHVRISAHPEVQAVRVQDSLGQSTTLPIEPGTRGVWFAVPAGASIAAVQEVSAPALLTQGPGSWQIIHDPFAGASAVSPVPGTENYMLVGQYDCDVTIAESGVIDPQRVIAQVERLIAAGKGSKWGVLDFEEPFDALWDAGDSDPRYRPALASMVATIRALKARYPNIHWTYYGIPRVKYWFSDGEWALVTPEVRADRYAKAVAPVADVMMELDFVMPGVYDVYERSMGMPTTRTPRVEAEAWWRRANVEAILAFYRSREVSAPPIIPMVTPWFQAGGFATAMRPIPQQEFIEEQVRPLVEAGASGIGIWGGMRYALYVTRWPGGHPSASFLALREEIRSAFARDYLPGRGLGSVDWTDPALQQQLADSLDSVMSMAIAACESEKP
jgi:hypothetical protein